MNSLLLLDFRIYFNIINIIGTPFDYLIIILIRLNSTMILNILNNI
jgi:hypothetical protein